MRIPKRVRGDAVLLFGRFRRPVSYDVEIHLGFFEHAIGSLVGAHFDVLAEAAVRLDVGDEVVPLRITGIPGGAMTEFRVAAPLPRAWLEGAAGPAETAADRDLADGARPH